MVWGRNQAMTNSESKDPVRAVVLASQIIYGCLIFGPIPVLLIAYFIGPMLAGPQAAAVQAGVPAGDLSDQTFKAILSYAAIGAAALAVLMSFILPKVISAAGAKSAAARAQPGGNAGKAATLESIDEQRGRLLPLFQTQLIIRAAILEGAAFFAAVMYMLTGNLILAGVAIALLLVMLAAFPTRPRLDRWLEQQQERLRDAEFAQS
jgi:hypothetical protein